MKRMSLFCALFFALSAHANGFLPIANVVKIKGHAFINKEEIKEGAEIVRGALVKVPKKGDYLIIKFQNGHVVKFTEATVKVEEFTEKISLLHLMKGQLHSLVKALTPDEKFIIKTKHASFAVRGTKFGVTLDDKKKKTYLCVCEGTVEATKGKMSVDVHKNEDLWIGASTKALQATPAPTQMSNMTNDTIAELEAL